MSGDEQDELGREVFRADSDNVPVLAVNRDAVIRGGRQRRVRRRAIVAGIAAASIAGVVLGSQVISELFQDPPSSPAATTDDGAEHQQSEVGWRLLGDASDEGEPGRTEVATTDEQLERLWRAAGFSGPAPEVDWNSEIVVWFGAIWSSGQEIQLTGVVVDGDVLYPLTPTSESPSGGPADARPHAFVVAIDRSTLPAAVPLYVQLGAEPAGGGWPAERTLVEVDLSEPGATASDEQLRDDPDLTPAIPRTVDDGDSIAVGEEVIFWFTPSECGWELLGTFDSVGWRLSEETAPPQDLPPVEGDATLTREAEDQIVFSIPETDLIYVPAEDDWSCGP